MRAVIPVMITTPQNTSKPVIISDTDIRPKNLDKIPIVVIVNLIARRSNLIKLINIIRSTRKTIKLKN